MKLTSGNVIIIILLIFGIGLLIVNLIKPAPKPSTDVEAIKEENKKLKERIEQDSVTISNLDGLLTNLHSERDSLDKRYSDANSKRVVAERRYHNLKNQYKGSDTQVTADEVFVACDSLLNEKDTEVLYLQAKLQNCDSTTVILMTSLKYRQNQVEAFKIIERNHEQEKLALQEENKALTKEVRRQKIKKVIGWTVAAVAAAAAIITN